MYSRPLRLTRRRLAAWYTSVMTVILVLCGFALYRLIIHARWLNLEREMQTMATVLEDRIEPTLTQPGQIDSNAQTRLPGLCPQGNLCPLPSPTQWDDTREVELSILRTLTQHQYCVRLLNLENQPIASIQLLHHKPVCNDPEFWRRSHNWEGHYYHQASYPLQTHFGERWGTMQMARSVNDLDVYLFWVEMALVGLILLAIVLVSGSSWWLAGMAMQPVHQSYQKMQQFTADAAHELRTPLAALQAMVQVALRAEDLSLEDATEVLQTVNRQSQRLTKLAQDLLILCQLDQQSRSLPMQPCCLNSLVKDGVEEFRALAIAADVVLSIQIAGSSPIYVAGNTEQLNRALSNLISNAIQYTPATGQVIVTLSGDSTQAVLQVIDTGVGISESEQQRIFDRFYRVSQGRSRHQGGSGLGLAITQALVQTHHGTLQVQSQVGRGSTFTIRLPLWQGK
jgi:signal transduction histidine kinase